MSEQRPRARRRIEEAGQRRPLPVGCMAWGAVLGILVGVMFALYGLPPILRAIYGPETVAAGETYQGDAKSLTVTGVAQAGGEYRVELQARTNRTWDLTGETWQLEVEGQDEWIPALAADPDQAETSFDFELGEERMLLLRFPVPDGGGEPQVLHLDDPRVRFELQGRGDD
ncbi:MAG: hypothetical protein U5Q44_14395 [Dehalococcoidia bacterium]|nr:hypothetical protein [Dehalococcoidia bacterium]